MRLFETARSMSKVAMGAALLACIINSSGCETGGQTGALAGAGIGALAGQAIGGNTAGTLIGAAVGTGIGYMIGNEQDKKHAREMSQNQPPSAPTNSEVGTLGGTRWKLVSLAPQSITTPYTSKIVEFRPNGRVVTTTTRSDGSVAVYDESYRVMGDTLITLQTQHEVSGALNPISTGDYVTWTGRRIDMTRGHESWTVSLVRLLDDSKTGN